MRLFQDKMAKSPVKSSFLFIVAQIPRDATTYFIREEQNLGLVLICFIEDRVHAGTNRHRFLGKVAKRIL